MKRSTGTPVNLLPLLDVLLCTMGTLIVVLGVLNRLARTHSVDQAREDRAIAKEQITLRIEQLTASREKTIADLEMARRRLSGVEDHSRQLADKLKTLAAAAQELSAKKPEDDKREALRRELGQLNAERWGVEKDLEAARRAGVQHKLMFSIVPFDGVFQTNRRPIYIECRGDAIILQPEGIVFTPTDFLGPPGPGNPLASTLRATQEYWSQMPPPAADVKNEPYPLLLVRPNGIIAYYLARDAMASWNTQFGYELISADGKLDFPAAPDPRLVEMEKRAVEDARQRLQWLAKVSPEAFQHNQKTQYRVSAIRGGLVRDGAPSLGNDPFSNDPLGGFGKSALGNSAGNGNMDSGLGGKGAYPSGSGDLPSETRLADVRGSRALGSGGYGPGNGSGNDGAGGYGPDGYSRNGSTGLGMHRNAIGGSDGGSGDRIGATSGGTNTAGGGGNHIFGNEGGGNDALGIRGTGTTAPGGAAGSPLNGLTKSGTDQSLVGPRYASAGTGASTPESGPLLDAPGMSTSQGNGSGKSHTSFNTGGSSGSGGDGSTGGDSSTGGKSAESGLASGGSSASSGGNAMTQSGAEGQSDVIPFMGGTPTTQAYMKSATMRDRESSSHKLANERGRNWALQNNTNSSVPITRPIRIECWNDRLILVPDARDQQPQVIPLADRTDEAVDQLVAAVRVHTQSWGLAGRSMYWKPQLVLDVKPTAESRAADLATLLADSGLDVKRR